MVYLCCDPVDDVKCMPITVTALQERMRRNGDDDEMLWMMTVVSQPVERSLPHFEASGCHAPAVV